MAQGFRPKLGVYHFDTYAPTASTNTIRLWVSLAVTFRLACDPSNGCQKNIFVW